MLLAVKKDRQPPTPWGPAHDVEIISPSIRFYSTASHGGLRLMAAARKQLGAKLQVAKCPEWWEEDTAISVPAIFFPELETWARCRGFAEKVLSHWKETCRDWHPLEYTMITGEPTTPENSRKLRHAKWHADNHGKLQAVSAWGSWMAGVPEGMVGVCAYPVGSVHGLTQSRWFIVGKEAYAQRGEFNYLIRPEDKEVPEGTFNQ